MFAVSESFGLSIPTVPTGKPKNTETNGCSNMAMEIFYITSGCLGQHSFVSGSNWVSSCSILAMPLSVHIYWHTKKRASITLSLWIGLWSV